MRHVGAALVRRGLPRSLTIQEVQRLLKAANGSQPLDLRDQAMIEAVKEDTDQDLEQKPYPNNHACVIDANSKVVGSQTREHDGKKYTVRLSEHGDHSYLYPKDTWSEESARGHCNSHKGSFEPASGKDVTLVSRSCGDTLTFTEPVPPTQPKAEPEPVDLAANQWYQDLDKLVLDIKNLKGEKH